MPEPSPLLGVIFDRDGVLIDDVHFTAHPDDIRWTPGAVELIRLLNTSGVKALVATNQSGIARGYFTEDQVQLFHAAMQRQLRDFGARIDSFAYCPHHPSAGSGGFTKVCPCRKPSPGMLLHLMERYNLPASATLMVGDRDVDMGAAVNAGVEGLLFTGGHLLRAFEEAGYVQRLPSSAAAQAGRRAARR